MRTAAAAQISSWFENVDITDVLLLPAVQEDDPLPPMHLLLAANAQPECSELQAAAKVILLLYGLDVHDHQGSLSLPTQCHACPEKLIIFII